MDNVVRLVGPQQAVEILGVRLVGVSVEAATKLFFTVAFLAIVLLATRVVRAGAVLVLRRRVDQRAQFWVRQAIGLAGGGIVLLGLLSIWFDEPGTITTLTGLVTAGLAFALQKLITAFAGYCVILRGRTFNVGDRITMGGVRGDVIALGFVHTTIMEMGQPPSVQNADPAMWIKSRQYTGRIVTVSNGRIFDEPVYNYTRDFPYIWEEIILPIRYTADRVAAERILLGAAERYSLPITSLGEDALRELERRYFMSRAELGPKVYLRLTDNWLELTLRFLCHDHGIRPLKDSMSRYILESLERADIEIATASFELVGLPKIEASIRNNAG